MREEMARTCHEANRAYCESIGDMSQETWDGAPAWQRDSTYDGIAFHLENPDAGPGASHERWMQGKLEAGWAHGDEKDPDRKLHPCIVPFEELPIEQQRKDKLFRAIVHALA